jgi:hypothetical protein
VNLANPRIFRLMYLLHLKIGYLRPNLCPAPSHSSSRPSSKPAATSTHVSYD